MLRDRTTDSLRQLDYILVCKKWRNSVHNAEAYNTLSTVISDHRVVCARVKLSHGVSKAPKKVKYDWTQLAQNSGLQQQYTVAVKNRYQVLADDRNETRYEKFVQANREAMEECLPKMTKSRRELRSSDDRVSAARQEVELAQTCYENSNQEADKELWREAVHNLYQTYKLVEKEELASQIQIIEAAHGEQRPPQRWRT